MKEKIAYLMKSEGLTTTRLAEILGTQPSRISHIVSGRNNPSYDLLQTILRRFPRINPDWLLLDSEQVYREDDTTALSLSSEPIDSSSVNLFANGMLDGSQFSRSSVGVNERNNRGVSADDPLSFDAQNSGENKTRSQGQNQAQFPTDIFDSKARVERIIVLYSDNTFRTYNLR